MAAVTASGCEIKDNCEAPSKTVNWECGRSSLRCRFAYKGSSRPVSAKDAPDDERKSLPHKVIRYIYVTVT